MPFFIYWSIFIVVTVFMLLITAAIYWPVTGCSLWRYRSGL